MKRLNKKGFTLIELLAVIVVLAIVMVIAATSILRSTSNAAVNSLNSSALTVANFVKEQQSLYKLGTGNAEICYENWVKGKTVSNDNAIGDSYASCFGLNTDDYGLTFSSIKISEDATTKATEVSVTLCAKTKVTGSDVTYSGKFANIESNDDVTIGNSMIPTAGPKSAKCVTVNR